MPLAPLDIKINPNSAYSTVKIGEFDITPYVRSIKISQVARQLPIAEITIQHPVHCSLSEEAILILREIGATSQEQIKDGWPRE